MYAIVKTGGKQYRVEPGQSLLVERLPEDEGATVALQPLMYRGEGDEVALDATGLAKVKVEATVVATSAARSSGSSSSSPSAGTSAAPATVRS